MTRGERRWFFLAALLGLGGCREEGEPPRPPLTPDAETSDAGAMPGEDAGTTPGDAAVADAGDLHDAAADGMTWGCVWGECVSQNDIDGDGHTADADCDDGDPDVYPGFGGTAEEGPWGAPTCCDGKDNDCDGVVDGGEEGFDDGCCHLWAPCMAVLADSHDDEALA